MLVLRTNNDLTDLTDLIFNRIEFGKQFNVSHIRDIKGENYYALPIYKNMFGIENNPIHILSERETTDGEYIFEFQLGYYIIEIKCDSNCGDELEVLTNTLILSFIKLLK
jgi:hypothetical protein